MDTIIVAALNGLVVGASLALVAAGLALLFGVLDILNFAQGDFFMLGAYAVWLILGMGLNFWLGLAVGVVVVGIGGGLLMMLLLWPLRNRSHALMLLATLAISLILEQWATDRFGADSKPVAAPVNGRIMIGSTAYPVYYLLVVVAAAVILLAGYLFLRYAKYGIWLRAVAQNSRMAGLLGVPVVRVYALTFIVASSLAAIGGSLLAPLQSVYPTLGLDTSLDAFVVVIAGGLGNFRGAAILALALGLVESIGSTWVQGEAIRMMVYGLVIVLLIVRALRGRGAVRV